MQTEIEVLRAEIIKLTEDKIFWFDVSSKYALEIEVLTKAHIELIESRSKLRTEYDVLRAKYQERRTELHRAENSVIDLRHLVAHRDKIICELKTV